MKIKKLFLMLFIVFILLPLNIKAENTQTWGTQSSDVVPAGCGGGDSCWSDFFSSTGTSVNGIRISLYKFDNNIITKIGQSYDFLYEQDAIDYLKGNSNINYISEKTGKIDYLAGTGFNITNGSNFGSNISSSFLLPSAFLTSNSIDFISLFNTNKAAIQTQYFNNKVPADIDKYYFVIEPTTLILYNIGATSSPNGIYFYGTSYEHMRYIDSTGVSYNWVRAVTNRLLPHSMRIESTTNINNYSINSFLSAANGLNTKLANPNNPNHQKEYMKINGYYIFKNDYIKTYAYGMYVLNVGSYLKPTIVEEKCDNSATVNQCENIVIVEDNKKLCTLANPSNYLTSYTDTVGIWCTNNVSTNFSDFYSTFDTSKRSGSYFTMNNLVIKNTKTCYTDNVSSGAKGWENKIYENLKGDINLTIGNRTYNLVESVSSDSIVCNEYSGDVCAKATLTTTHNYHLNYLTNRFISINSMKEDEVICPENDTDKCKTLTNIDNGGPRLTIPLNYLSGSYRYNLDLKSSLLSTFKSRLVNKKISEFEFNDKIYNITYTTNKSITDLDLTFSCPYKATQDMCKDGDNLVPCPVADCKYECCDKDGKEVACPKQCQYECCDADGKEVECPGSDSILSDIIYRPISLTNPFPGIGGTGRTPGSNWEGIVNINGKQYTLIDRYITYNRGVKDYEVYNKEPLYVIELDNAKMKAIRTYNKSHDYNDFELSCINGENCISKFLRGNLPDFNINLISSGTCKNISNYDFNSCLE